MATISCTYGEFQSMAAEFFRAAETANEEQLDAGLKCLGLAYLGIQWGDSPIDRIHRQVGAPIIVRLATKRALEREVEINLCQTTTQNDESHAVFG